MFYQHNERSVRKLKENKAKQNNNKKHTWFCVRMKIFLPYFQVSTRLQGFAIFIWVPLVFLNSNILKIILII